MSFGDDLKKFKEKTEKAGLSLFIGTALDVFGRFVKRTPVKTGRARSNWQVGVNSAKPGLVNSTSGPPTPMVAQTKLGDSIYITNNLPYILPLEHGSSNQAPAGMVKVTLLEFPKIVKKNA